MLSDSIVAKFWEYVEIKEGCWGWNANKNRGYGTLYTAPGSSPARANRVSWEIHFGQIPEGLNVCHKCDNPECTRPDHLFLGTQKENIADALRKGRLKRKIHKRGIENPAATLSLGTVRDIRNDYTNGMQISELETKYKHSNITRIVKNHAYYDPQYTPINGNKRPRPFRKKLSDEHIVEILHSTLSLKELGRRYGVSDTTIGKVKKGRY
jgi:hypothetical protein